MAWCCLCNHGKDRVPSATLGRKRPTTHHSQDSKTMSDGEKKEGREERKSDGSKKDIISSPMDNCYCCQPISHRFAIFLKCIAMDGLNGMCFLQTLWLLKWSQKWARVHPDGHLAHWDSLRDLCFATNSSWGVRSFCIWSVSCRSRKCTLGLSVQPAVLQASAGGTGVGRQLCHAEEIPRCTPMVILHFWVWDSMRVPLYPNFQGLNVPLQQTIINNMALLKARRFLAYHKCMQKGHVLLATITSDSESHLNAICCVNV